MQALTGIAYQFCHGAWVKDQGAHYFVQFCKKIWGGKNKIRFDIKQLLEEDRIHLGAQ